MNSGSGSSPQLGEQPGKAPRPPSRQPGVPSHTTSGPSTRGGSSARGGQSTIGRGDGPPRGGSRHSSLTNDGPQTHRGHRTSVGDRASRGGGPSGRGDRNDPGQGPRPRGSDESRAPPRRAEKLGGSQRPYSVPAYGIFIAPPTSGMEKRKTAEEAKCSQKGENETPSLDSIASLTTVADDSTRSNAQYTAPSMTGQSPATSQTDVLASPQGQPQPQLTVQGLDHANDAQPGSSGDTSANGAPRSFELPFRPKVEPRRAHEKAVQDRDSQAELVKWLEKQLVEGKAELARRQALVDAHTE